SAMPNADGFFPVAAAAKTSSSRNTIAAYALTFRLLLQFTSARSGTSPSKLDIADLDAPLIAAFLEHLERERGNTTATRNTRLAAIHSLFSYLALHHPEHAGSIRRVLSIPNKRTEVNLVTYLNDDEATALLAACDQRRWTGRRDHTMLALTIQTGLRISELIGLNCVDVTLGRGANVHTLGKGRKERRTPLVPSTVQILQAFLAERAAAPNETLFATSTGRRLSRDAVEHRLAHHVALAQTTCPSLGAKRITMHTLRHTAAMRLLLAGNDVTVIALWLGHEQLATTNIYQSTPT
ncbi:MAG: tyrosine-type recombinase/integrase, partial [Dermatophilaceae bacterium]